MVFVSTRRAYIYSDTGTCIRNDGRAHFRLLPECIYLFFDRAKYIDIAKKLFSSPFGEHISILNPTINELVDLFQFSSPFRDHISIHNMRFDYGATNKFSSPSGVHISIQLCPQTLRDPLTRFSSPSGEHISIQTPQDTELTLSM